MAYRQLEELGREWRQRRGESERRLADFRRAGAGSDERLFREMAFCLFAVQTSAHRSDDAVRALAANGLPWRGALAGVRSGHRRVPPAARPVSQPQGRLSRGGEGSLGPRGLSGAVAPDDASDRGEGATRARSRRVRVQGGKALPPQRGG